MMDYSAASPPGTQTPVTGVPPRLGTPVPGTTGGLPTQQGLNVSANPMAQQLQSQGRGDDKMLVHMTPGEVGGLQQLAMAHGGSLTINPQTGLPEAGFLSKILPTILGVAGAAFGIPTWAIGLGVGAGQTALTGDLGKGLSAGLQAFGGAGIGQAAGLGGKLGSLGKDIGLTQSVTGGVAANAPTADAVKAIVKSNDMRDLATVGAGVGKSAGAGVKGFLGKFGAETALGQTGLVGKALPMMAGSAVLGGVSDAMQPKLRKYNPDEEGKSTYAGPYVPGQRQVQIQPYEEMMRTGGAERQMFTPSNPVPGFRPVSALDIDERAEYGFADGGLAELPASRDFKATMDYFNAQNPGAITASMYPVAAEMPTRETTYNFNRPAAPSAPVNTGGPGMGMIGMPDFSNIDLNSILAQIGYAPRDGTPATTPVPGRDIASAPTTDLYRGGIEIPAATSFNPSMPSVGGDTGGLEALTPSLNIQPPSQLYDIPAPQVMGIEEPARFSPSAPQFDTPSQLESAPVSFDYRDFAPAPTMPSESIYDMRYGRGMEMDEFARGGEVNMRDGAFVVDARTVSELGNGSSNAGMELLARMGGKPLHGPGDGVSDSIPARIGGKQEARVARDEVIFPPEAVKRLGKGSEAKGTAKLYALMDKAHKARKKAKRGEDTKVRKGLA
jgi:hypothetical protein